MAILGRRRWRIVMWFLIGSVLWVTHHVRDGDDTDGPYALRDVGMVWPCAPIHYQISNAELPQDFLTVVNGAIGRVTAASGYRFYYDGLTPDRDFDARRRIGTSAPVLIGFATAGEDHGLGGDVVGLGTSAPGVAGFLGTGMVELDAAAYEKRSDLAFRQAIVMHELGHVLGLAHVEDRHEIMNPEAGATEFGPGDRAGLKVLFTKSCPNGQRP